MNNKGWFYPMLAVSTVLEKGRLKTRESLGHILAENA
jgi:hypothetical protein